MELNEHQETCEYELVKCPFEGCQDQGIIRWCLPLDLGCRPFFALCFWNPFLAAGDVTHRLGIANCSDSAIWHFVSSQLRKVHAAPLLFGQQFSEVLPKKYFGE